MPYFYRLADNLTPRRHAGYPQICLKTRKKVLVNIDYHVEIEGHYYSVPYALVRKGLEARYTERTVECFHKGQRVASHIRSHLKGRHTTVAEHMPESHRQYLEWTPERLIRWAEKTGPATAGSPSSTGGCARR